MKKPISWHKECLANSQRTAAQYREEANRKVAEADRLRNECIAYDAQIIEAEIRGLKEFDRDKLGKKRNGV